MGECPRSMAVQSFCIARCWSRYAGSSKAGGWLRVLKNRLSGASRHAHTLAGAHARSSLTVGNPAVRVGPRCSRPHSRLMRSNAPQALTTTRPWFFRCAQFSISFFRERNAKHPGYGGSSPRPEGPEGADLEVGCFFRTPTENKRAVFSQSS